jgi:hypothetical protein
MLGQEDRANVSRRLREGWELVRGTDLPPEWRSLPTMDSGRNEGVVYNEGLLLAKIPNETVEERRAYYAGKTQEAKDALDSRYVKYDPQRDTNVTFGRR